VVWCCWFVDRKGVSVTCNNLWKIWQSVIVIMVVVVSLIILVKLVVTIVIIYVIIKAYCHWTILVIAFIVILACWKLVLPFVIYTCCYSNRNWTTALPGPACAYAPTRALCSSISKLLQVPHTNLRFGSRSFCASAPTLWNSLPRSIRFCESLATFRKHLKTFYFQSAFPGAP